MGHHLVARVTRLALVAWAAALAPHAAALPVNATLFCGVYPAAPACLTGKVACTMCHAAGGPPALNPFGADVKAGMAQIPGTHGKADDFRLHLAAVLHGLEAQDSDGDGFANGVEIARGTWPGDPASHPGADDPGIYDAALALRRLQIVYCGISPTYEQMQALAARSDKHGFVHAALDACLASDAWLKDGMMRLADDRIRPQQSLGPGGYAEIGDYFYDYRLFAHALSGDRDARDLLTATYHVAEDGRVVEGVIPDQMDPNGRLHLSGEILEPEHRAGMLTTRWNIAMMTMFAVLPRNTAAQAYRSYLGLDIARSQGLEPVSGEPRDVDHMGVARHDCAVCHSTLDPLAYAFSPYMAFSPTLPNGQPRPQPPRGMRGNYVGGYVSEARTWENWGWLFGHPVNDLPDWAQQAANSEAFKLNLATMFYQHALGHGAETAPDQADLAALVAALPGDGYSANRMLHRLVDTNSFGAPGPAATPRVVWKRHKAVANDLARALALQPDDVCKEVGRYSCTDEVFLSPLGGNEPFIKGQYVPAAAPQATTPIALERVVLSACSQRVALDAEGAPAVFKELDLSRSDVTQQMPAFDRQSTTLYRSLVGRDPSPAELTVLHDLAVDDLGRPVKAADVARLLCFTIGTSQEFAFE